MRLRYLSLLLLLPLTACDGKSSTASEHTVQQYGQYCSQCHEVGAANAPRRGDEEQWEKRLRKGEDNLLSSIKTGLVAMPPRGGCADCSDDDFRALIKYMSE